MSKCIKPALLNSEKSLKKFKKLFDTQKLLKSQLNKKTHFRCHLLEKNLIAACTNTVMKINTKALHIDVKLAPVLNELPNDQNSSSSPRLR